jgi:carotenoid cleavage dioxygenase
VLSSAGRVLRETPIPVEHGPSIHDCGFTARYVVILDLPVTFSMRSLIGGHRFPYKWNPKHRARVGLLPRARDASARHLVRCRSCLRLSCGERVRRAGRNRGRGCRRLRIDVQREPARTEREGRALERWTIDPVAKSVKRKVIDAQPQEFPAADERRLGQPYRYIYASASPSADEVPARQQACEARHGGRDSAGARLWSRPAIPVSSSLCRRRRVRLKMKAG